MVCPYSSLGTMIEGSGGSYISSKADIIAIESMGKFLKGKMYICCKRGHILLSKATQGLNLESRYWYK